MCGNVKIMVWLFFLLKYLDESYSFYIKLFQVQALKPLFPCLFRIQTLSASKVNMRSLCPCFKCPVSHILFTPSLYKFQNMLVIKRE